MSGYCEDCGNTGCICEEIEKAPNRKWVDGDQARKLLESIYQLRCNQLPFDKPLDQLIWCVLGRIQ
jgi:hypothetical protein